VENIWNAKNRLAGELGENTAEKYLINLGFVVLIRNYRKRYGEVDLICKKGDELWAIEVKLRNGELFGLARESVDFKKVGKINKVMRSYCFENSLEFNWVIGVIALQLIGKKDNLGIYEITFNRIAE